MSDLVQGVCLAAYLLGLGFFFGRVSAKPKETWQHRLGVQLAETAKGWRDTKAFVGDPVIVTRVCTLVAEGQVDVELCLREPAA